MEIYIVYHTNYNNYYGKKENKVVSITNKVS
jgi:hypothetical protein